MIKININEEYLKRFNIITGAIIIIFAISILYCSIIPLLWTVILLSVSVIIIGFTRLFNSFYDKKLIMSIMVFRIVTGLIALLLASITIFSLQQNFILELEILVFLNNFIFLLIGIERIVSGIILKNYMKQIKILLIISGLAITILSIIASFYALINDVVFALFLMALVLLIFGSLRITVRIWSKRDPEGEK